MEKMSMTALVSAFARIYHHKHYEVKIFDDHFGEKLISEETYEEIAKQMTKGILFFDPGFKGSDEEALQFIVNEQLSPTPLGRAAYSEKMLENAIRIGTSQYLIFASGYDTYPYRQKEDDKHIQIFEIDHPFTLRDKNERLKRLDLGPMDNLHQVEGDLTETSWREKLLSNKAFDPTCLSFCSLLGLSYYLTKDGFKQLIGWIAEIVPRGSTLVFDYPDQDALTDKAGPRAIKQVMMAAHAGEGMQSSYTYDEMEKLLEERGFLIYEHLDPPMITSTYFSAYNLAYPDKPMSAFDNVNYCLAVKQA